MIENVEPKNFFVLDLDRCLLDLDETMRRYSELVTQYHPSLGARLDWACTEAESNGDSFDVYKYLVNELDKEAIEDLNRFFITMVENENLLNAGAGELTENLALSKHEYGILTHGSLRWQTLKLRASGLDRVPHLITAQKEKGRLIASWRQANGEFLVPNQLLTQFGQSAIFSSVILVDDKADSFTGLPPGAHGYLYRNPHYKTLPSQRGDISGAVTIIDDFRQVVNNELLGDNELSRMATVS